MQYTWKPEEGIRFLSMQRIMNYAKSVVMNWQPRTAVKSTRVYFFQPPFKMLFLQYFQLKSSGENLKELDTLGLPSFQESLELRSGCPPKGTCPFQSAGVFSPFGDCIPSPLPTRLGLAAPAIPSTAPLWSSQLSALEALQVSPESYACFLSLVFSRQCSFPLLLILKTALGLAHAVFYSRGLNS